MALSPPGSLLDDFAGTVDGAAREAGPGDDVAGVPARWVAAPSTTEEAAELLAVAARTGTTVVVRGRGTALHLAPPPHSADLLVSTNRLDGVVEHEAGDLVCTVQAGTRLDDVNAAVSDAGQQLALDQPMPGSSVGGTLSTNRSGPRRLLYGTPRDLVLGVTMVRTDGVIAKAGGKVVKNVAGYDLAKLLGGAHGTLGLVTRMVVRLHPLPQAASWVTRAFVKPDAAVAAALRVAGSQVFPSAVELHREAGTGTTEVCVLLEGTGRGVAGRVAEVARMLGDGAAQVALDTADVAQVDADIDDLLVKVALPLTALAGLLSAVAGIERRLDLPCRLTGSAGAGVLHVVCQDVVDRAEAAAEAVAVLRGASRAADGGGSAVVLQAPPKVRGMVDSWGPVPALDLMRRVKREFDPDGRFAAGRFVGGI